MTIADPPAHSVEAEQNVLGSLLLDQEQWERVAPLIAQSDFFRPDHRIIYAAIADLKNSGLIADAVTVAEHLKLGRQLDDAGGMMYVATLARDTAVPSHAQIYAEIVKSHAMSRALEDVGRELASGDSTPLERAHRAIETLSRLTSTRVASESLALLRGSEVKIEPTNWLWHEWLVGGCLQVFAGPAGLGKTTIAISLAATLTRGGLWPDGSRCTKRGAVIFWSGEDDIAKTLMPRFLAMDGDPDSIYFVDAVTVDEHGKRQTREFDPSSDIPLLIEAANKVENVRLFVVDPVSMCVAGDSNKNAEVRRGLAPLKTFAERHGAATLGISHFSKGSEGRDPLSRVTGSLAFGAAPRLVLSAVTEAKKPDEPEDAEPRHLFIRTKSNLGPCGDGFRYTVEQVPLPDGITGSRIVWGEHLKGGARELLADAEQHSDDPGEHKERQEAVQFLHEALADGRSVPSKDLYRKAKQEGHFSERTLRRAAHDLGVQRVKLGKDGPWVCRLGSKVATTWPASTGQETVAAFGGSGHLQPEPQENGHLEKGPTPEIPEGGQGGHAQLVRKEGHLPGQDQDKEAF